MSSENRWIRFQPFGQARAALEDDFVAGRGGDDPQGLGDVVVLLDDGRAQARGSGNVPPPGGSPARNRDVQKVSRLRLSFACHSRACANPASTPKSNRENGFKDSCNRRRLLAGSCRAARRSRRASRARAAARSPRLSADARYRPFSGHERQQFVRRFPPATVRSTCRVPQEIEQGRVGSERLAHAAGRRVWITVSAPTSFRGRLKPVVATSLRAGFCVVNPRRLAAAMPAGKTVVALGRELSDRGRIRPALAEGGLPGAVIDALAQPLDRPGRVRRESAWRRP